jgi:CRISPR system Cascade subunit CasE
MFLSEVLLNARNPLGRKDLASAYELHRTLSSGFPDGGRPRLLFRQESSAPRVLMLSCEEPLYNKSLETGRLLFVRTKPFEPRVSAGQQLRFRLRANPTKKRKDGAREALLQPADQMAWFAKKGQQHGFRLLSVHIVGEEVLRTPRGDGSAMTHLAVDFHGTLEVTETELFAQALRSGIGSAKAFGFGMLCVSP